MKFRSLIYAMSLLLAAPFFAACNDDDIQEEVTTIETTRIKNVTYNSAVAVSYIVGNYSDRGICYSENENPTTAGKTLPAVGKVEFESEITGLTSGKTYYVRTYAIVNGKPVYGEQKSFTTVADGEPFMSIVTASDVTEISASLKATLMATGGKKVTSRAIAWVKDEGDLEGDIAKIVAAGDIPGELANRAGIYTENEGGVCEEFFATAENLDDESTYGMVAFAIADGKVYAGEVTTFKTVAYKVPVASIVEVKNVTGFGMTVKCKIETVNPLEVTGRGILYGTSTAVGSATEVAATAAGEGEFEVTLDGLNEGTTYYLWAYGENRKGRATSARQTQTTLSVKPFVEINSLTNVIGHSVNATLKVTSLGVYNSPLTEVGFVYGTTSTPTITSSTCTKVVLDGDVNVNEAYEKVLGALKHSTRVYVRAFATNEYGTSYSSTVNATTKDDFYQSYVRLFDEGGSGKLPLFNGMQSNPVAYSSKYETSATSDVSPYWLDMFNGVAEAIAASGRTFARMTFQWSATDEAGTDRFLRVLCGYVNSEGKEYNASIYMRIVQNTDGSITADVENKFLDGNYTGRYKAMDDDNKAKMDALVNFFAEDFYVDYLNSNITMTSSFVSGGVLKLVHKNNPSEYISCCTLTWTGVVATDPGFTN